VFRSDSSRLLRFDRTFDIIKQVVGRLCVTLCALGPPLPSCREQHPPYHQKACWNCPLRHITPEKGARRPTRVIIGVASAGVQSWRARVTEIKLCEGVGRLVVGGGDDDGQTMGRSQGAVTRRIPLLARPGSLRCIDPSCVYPCRPMRKISDVTFLVVVWKPKTTYISRRRRWGRKAAPFAQD
jgi:hypothetical protein